MEVDLKTLFSNAKHISPVRPHVDEIPLHSGRKVYLVGKGRIANLVAAEGHPPEMMQMSFANQLVAAIRTSMIDGTMKNKVYGVPDEIEHEIARAALKSMGVSISNPPGNRRSMREAGRPSGDSSPVLVT